MKITNKEEWLELVINYDACGTDVFNDIDVSDAQREAVACACRDMRHVEERDGDSNADDFCESAKEATYGWMEDFNK